MSASLPVVTIDARALRAARASHPWIFRDDLIDAGGAQGGDLVRIVDPRGAALGYAHYSRQSKIALRRVTRADRPPDAAFWDERMGRALAHRTRVAPDQEAMRLIFAESDGFPGLIVDRYGEHLVVQCLTAAMEALLPVVLASLEARLAPASVLARNDAAVRTLEGLPRETRQLRGLTPEALVIREGRLLLGVDPWHGQKTGAFLDQRENRVAAGAYARGRVLDLFCYQGAFALQAAAGATEVVAVDSSARALASGRTDAARNDVHNVTFHEANVFDDLRQRVRRQERFDLVLLDPPALAKARADLPAAARAYKELNLRAMRLLEPGGMLITSSCSYNLGEEGLLEVLAQAAADAHCSLRVLEKRTQSRDHPIRLGFPESHYLKCLVLEMI